MSYLKNEFQQTSIFLLPVRIFMGLAWMRAGLEKFFDPQWYSGESITLFFQEQLHNGDIVFPFYESLVLSTFEPNAGILAGIILFAEFYVGIAVLLGCFTNLALMGGIFMNVNFLLAGSANPSIFYIVIQAFLLFMRGGSVFSMDSIISQRVHSSFFVAQKEAQNVRHSISPRILICLAEILLALALWSTMYIQDMTLGTPDDPALSVIMLCLMTAVLLVILAVRSWSPNKENTAQTEYMSIDSVPTINMQPDAQVAGSAPAIPQMSINNYATLLVPHNLVDKGEPAPTRLVGAKPLIATKSTVQHSSMRHRSMKSISAETPNTVFDTINEVSTLFTSHNLRPHNLLDEVAMENADSGSQNKLQKISVHI